MKPFRQITTLAKFGALFTLLGLVLIACGTESLTDALGTSAAADRDSSAVDWWWGDEAGTSSIVRTDSGISGNVRSSLANDEQDGGGLAVTLWIVVFNEPDECEDGCNGPDLFNPAVMGDVIYGAGNVVGGSENVGLGYHLSEGDAAGSIIDIIGLPGNNGEAWGLIDARKAEIHYVVRSHGPKVPSEMPAQIHSFNGGCVTNYGPPADGAHQLQFGLGDCLDVQFAIYLP